MLEVVGELQTVSCIHGIINLTYIMSSTPLDFLKVKILMPR